MDDHILIKRQGCAQATLDRWKDKSFKLGERDCVRMTADHLRRCGYSVKLPAKGSYGTLLSATKKLKELGYSTVAEAVSFLGFEQIAPAAALTGDIIELPGEDGDKESPLSALCIALGNGRALGFYDGVGCAVLQPLQYKSAWRVEPKS